jgi:AmmeMemoRadiSam system protein B
MSDDGRIVRVAHGSGRWFPATCNDLYAAVSSSIEAAVVPPLHGPVLGLIAPHAGYDYSGAVAGASFRALRDSMPLNDIATTVVVLGFSHSDQFQGLALMDGDGLKTPLGEVELDCAVSDQLVNTSPYIQYDYAPHVGEHSAENQIPYIQLALPQAKVVVGLFGDRTAATRDSVVSALGRLCSEASEEGPVATRIVIVASTDLLHDANYEKVCRVDKQTLTQIAELDGVGLENAWSPAEQVCCGISPVLSLMQLVQQQGGRQGTVLMYGNSGDTCPESRGDWVVGYGAVAFSFRELSV